MGFEKTTNKTGYDMVVSLTPLGVEKLQEGGLLESVRFFSVSDANMNYKRYEGLDYQYDINTGGVYSPTNPDIGISLNVRGSVDRNMITPNKALMTSRKSLSNYIWQYPTVNPVEEMLMTFKLSNGDKEFNKPIILGGRNMWHNYLSEADNLSEGFLYYLPPTTLKRDYISTTEPTLGDVPTGTTINTPFPGISVNDGRRSFTEIQYFNYLNKTNTRLFITSFVVQNIVPTTHTVLKIETDEEYSVEFVKQSYYLDWEAVKDGKRYIDGIIHVYIPREIYDKRKKVLYPYETIQFGVSFEIYQAGSVVAHWRGQNYSDQLAREGQYEFDLVMTATPELNSTTIYNSVMKVITKVKDSAYNPDTYVSPIPVIDIVEDIQVGGGSGAAVT